MTTLDTAITELDVEVTDILEELDRLRAVNKQLKNALEAMLSANSLDLEYSFDASLRRLAAKKQAREALKAAS